MSEVADMVRIVLRQQIRVPYLYRRRVVNGVVQPDARDRLPDGVTITDIEIHPVDEERPR